MNLLKKTMMTAAAAALLAMPFAVPMAAYAQPAVTLPPAVSLNMNTPSTLNLSAQGDVTAAPDMATISFGVVTQSGSASGAMKANNIKMNQVLAALKSAGIDAKDIQTSNLNLSPQYTYNDNGAPPKLNGYNAQNQVSVRVNKLDQTGAVIDAVIAAGVNQIDSIGFGLKDDDAALDAARQAAVKTLMQRANLYATALGVKIKRIQTLSESTNDYSPPQPRAMMMMKSADASTPVAAGELKLSVTVSAVFEIE